ncbi:MAG TPA: thioredoxin family protein [Campylobacterales bacterium]|nr:thioredoxin family protein [Campylobacterales bacterium]HHS92637.1 thioredoxin family protein [Campylobacterales bacterium]
MGKLTLIGVLTLLSSNFIVAEENVTYFYSHDENSAALVIEETQEEVNTTFEPLVEANQTLVTLETNETTVEPKVTPFEEALKQAKDEDKIIMLSIRAINCHYCDRMETETLVEDEVQEALEKDFITLHYNQDLEELPLGFSGGMTPNFIFVDKDENILQMYPGMRTPEQFMEVLNEILAM